MLPDQQSQLLTAYVDGELAARERRAVEKLLSSSQEARQLLESLEKDAKVLRNLPVCKAPVTLADFVLETLNDNNPMPILSRMPVPAKPAKTIPLWLGLAVAGCVLVLVSLAAYFATAGLFRQGKKSENIAETPKEKVAEAAGGNAAAVAPMLADPLVADIVTETAKKFGETVSDRDIGMRLLVKELQTKATTARIAMEIKKAPAFRVDVPALNSAHALEQLTEAFKKAGITVLMDGSAKAGLANKQAKAAYVLYAENLRHDEIADILQRFGLAEATSPTGPSVDKMVMKPLTADDRSSVAKVLHVGVQALASAKQAPPGGQLKDLLERPPAMANDGSVPAPPERFAMLIAAQSNAKSAELNRFLASRQPLRDGTVQLVLFIHEAE